MSDTHDPYVALRSYQQALQDNPRDCENHLRLGHSFLDLGFINNAIDSFRRANRCALDRHFAGKILYQSIARWNEIIADFRAQKEVLGFKTERFLGAGWEGSVYIARDTQDQLIVLKAFHPAIMRLANYSGAGGIYRQPVLSSEHDLEKLTRIEANDAHALYPISLIRGSNGSIEGVSYRHERLLPITTRQVHKPAVAGACFGSFLATQAYLLKHHQLCLSDPHVLHQFMISLSGNLRYVDYGTTIIPINDFRCQDDHWEISAMINVLYSTFASGKGKAEYLGVQLFPTIIRGLAGAAQQHKPIQKIIGLIQQENFDPFLDYGFYEDLGAFFPSRISKPQAWEIYCRNTPVYAFFRSLRRGLAPRRHDDQCYKQTFHN